MTDRPSILGIGNPLRGDDGVGPYVVRRLEDQRSAFDLHRSDGEVAGLIAIFQRCTDLIVIDAAHSATAGVEDGETLRFNPRHTSLAREALRASSHTLGVAEAMELADALGCLPARLTVIAIAGSNFEPGAGLSTPVANAADALVAELTRLGIPAPGSSVSVA